MSHTVTPDTVHLPFTLCNPSPMAHVRLCHGVPPPGPAKERGFSPCSQVSLPAGRGHHHTRGPPASWLLPSPEQLPSMLWGHPETPPKGVSAAAVCLAGLPELGTRPDRLSSGSCGAPESGSPGNCRDPRRHVPDSCSLQGILGRSATHPMTG